MGKHFDDSVLVPTQWVEDHRADAKVRLIEVDVDTRSYAEGHLVGALAWDSMSDLSDVVRRDILSKSAFESLMQRAGIGNDTTVIGARQAR